MMRKHHSPQFKTRIVLEILSGEKELNAVCTENNLNLNMVSKDGKLSVRRQCELLSVNRTSIYYKPAEGQEIQQ